MSPYRTIQHEETHEELLWELLDEALSCWASRPGISYTLGFSIWREARKYGLRQLEQAADGLLGSFGTHT